jgi:hypothetical protein
MQSRIAMSRSPVHGQTEPTKALRTQTLIASVASPWTREVMPFRAM